MGKFIKFKTMAADHGLSPPFSLYVNEKEKQKLKSYNSFQEAWKRIIMKE